MERIYKQLRYNFSTRTQPIRYIVVHDTGNPSAGADAEAQFRYFNGGNKSSSADIFVDDGAVWFVNDYEKYYTWHCGDGNGKYGITNGNSIGLEICVNQDGNFEKAMQNAAQVVRELMDALDIPIERVVRHYDASRKLCPAGMAKNDWAMWKAFKKKVEEALSVSQYEELSQQIRDLTETVKALATEVGNLKNPMIYNFIDENMPEWARPAVQWAVDNGFIQGDGNGLALTDEKLWQLVVMKRIAER